MKINVELTEEERDALLFLLGAGLATAQQLQMHETAKAAIRILNKFYADSPDYIPYDESNIDISKAFPFEKVKPQ